MCSLHLLLAVHPWVRHMQSQSPCVVTVHLDILIFSGTIALVNVLRELKEVTHEWYELGLLLGLECSTLETIKATNQTVKECKRTMVVSWLQKKDNSSPSWQALVIALRDPLVNCPDIANQIEQNYT